MSNDKKLAEIENEVAFVRRSLMLLVESTIVKDALNKKFNEEIEAIKSDIKKLQEK